MVIKNFLNPKEHQHPISGSKLRVILLKGWILPIGAVASGRVSVCSLRSRLVFHEYGGQGSFDIFCRSDHGSRVKASTILEILKPLKRTLKPSGF